MDKCGPEFLSQPENQWPEQPGELVIQDGDVEIKSQVNIAVEIPNNSNVLSQLAERFSDMYRLIRCVCWLLKAKTTLKA